MGLAIHETQTPRHITFLKMSIKLLCIDTLVKTLNNPYILAFIVEGYSTATVSHSQLKKKKIKK